MSGNGAPTVNALGAETLNVTVVAGMWHTEIAEALVAGALRVLDTAGAHTTVVRVSGSFELPVVAQAALQSGADAVVGPSTFLPRCPRPLSHSASTRQNSPRGRWAPGLSWLQIWG